MNDNIILGVNSSKRQRQYTRVRPEVRFMAKVQKLDSGCWIWTAAKDAKGYGRFGREGGVKIELSHRSAYYLFVGPIPDGLFVLHKCDTPSCVNPDHLFLGTAADNTADMVGKWRTRSKLTPEDVREIRVDEGKSRDIASRYGLTHKSVLNIRHGRTFKASL